MTLFYSQNSNRSHDTGKFRSRPVLGTVKSQGGNYRDWQYEFISHQTGTSIRRTSYAVSISDPNGNKVEYLRGFSDIAQAKAAAHRWIDEVVTKIVLSKVAKGFLGSIPSMPKSNQEK